MTDISKCICEPEHGSLDYGGPAYTGNKNCPVHGKKTPELTEREALEALNQLRCNVIATQNAGWSNFVYPFVAILNKAGFEFTDPTDDQLRHHRATYGGAGGYPGAEKCALSYEGAMAPVTRHYSTAMFKNEKDS